MDPAASAPGEAILAVEAVRYAYGRGPGARAVLGSVSLDLSPGERLAVVGPNGAGKSTLLRLMAGLAAPDAGRIRLEGRDLAALGPREIARILALVPQAPELAPGFSVREVVAMGRAPHQGRLLRPSPRDEEVVREALRACELEELEARGLDELSGGEQRRVFFARALAQEPRVLLLDEPTASLDVGHAVALFDLVVRETSRRSLACAIVTHDLNAAAQYATRVALLAGGGLAALGPPEAVLAPARLAPVFGPRLLVGGEAGDGRPPPPRFFLPLRP